MRTTVIPAQITTVEDKIAGSLNLTQIIILMVPVFWTTIVYSIFPPVLKLSWYKLPLVLVVLVTSLILSLRIKGKVVINWLLVLLKYNLRPRYYLFNKNEAYLRNMDLPETQKRQHKLLNRAHKKKEMRIPAKSFGIGDLIKLRGFIHNPDYSLSLKPNAKGGFYVDLKQIEK